MFLVGFGCGILFCFFVACLLRMLLRKSMEGFCYDCGFHGIMKDMVCPGCGSDVIEKYLR